MVVALAVYRMPAGLMLSATAYGALFGLFPIGWIVYWAIVLYRITVETGKFEIIKDSIGGLTDDRRLQALLIAFAFGAFIEGAAGFGTPVAVAAAMLAGLGFSPYYAAGICLLANTAPVAFGSIGIPVVTLARITGLQEAGLSAWVGRICAPVSLFVPAYLIMVMGGWKALSGVLPAAALCGIVFASVQFLVSNYIGPQLTDILAAIAAIVALAALLKIWKPKDKFELEGDRPQTKPHRHRAGELMLAWSPYLFLVFFVLLSGLSGNAPIKNALRATPLAFLATGFDYVNSLFAATTWKFDWPHLAGLVYQVPPVAAVAGPYAADQTSYTFNFLAASGSACLMATLASMFALRLSPGRYAGILVVDRQATVRLDGHHCERSGPGLRAELLRRHRHHGTGVRRHGRRVPLLQLSARLAGRVPHRQRYFRQRSVRQPAGGHRQDAPLQPLRDGGRQLRRRRHGQDDLPAKHRRSGRRYFHGPRRRGPAVPLHPPPQYFSGRRGRHSS